MDFKWPTSDASFLKINSRNIVILKNNKDLEEEFYKYAINFKKAAHLLTQHLLENNDISKLDTYFFSLAYLYRQSLELVLKAIGFKYIVSLEGRQLFLKDTFHNLSQILDYIMPYIEEFIDKDIKGYAWIKTYFKDIDIVDKESDAFRYPFRISVDKIDFGFETKKKFSIKPVFEKQTHIDLVAFANKMEVAFEVLHDIYFEQYGCLDYYNSYKPIFIEEGGSYYGQSVVGYNYSREKFYPYVRAYVESAEYLYKMICKDSKLKETLFIAMCYLYRNAVELSLKQILFEECSFELDEALMYMNKKKHKVVGLWNLIKIEIEEHANAPEGDTTLTNVENYIIQLNNIDGTSDKFRYPTDKNLNLHFKDSKEVDVDNVNDFFGQLLSFLSAVDLMMSEHNELKAEIEAEYRSEMEFYYDRDDYY